LVGLSNVLNGGVFSPQELIGVSLSIIRPRSADIKFVPTLHGRLIHSDFIAVRQRTPKLQVGCACQAKRDAGEALPKSSLRIILLGTAAGNEFASPVIGGC
jgi:hypothetical protein